MEGTTYARGQDYVSLRVRFLFSPFFHAYSTLDLIIAIFFFDSNRFFGLTERVEVFKMADHVFFFELH